MSITDEISVADALGTLRHGDPAAASHWSFRFGPLTVTLPNFDWRRRAIDRHDLHHALLGEPFTMGGECRVAAWEFAAGAYPDIRPQLFCLPLVAAGLVLSPRRLWQSFRRGRRQRSLYGVALDRTTRLGTLRDHVEQSGRASSLPGDMALFGLLATASAALIAAPFLLAALLLR